MRFGLNRISSLISSLFSFVTPRRRPKPEPKKTRNKTEGPNWLKIAINSQKHR